MKKIGNLFQWLLGKSAPSGDPVAAALAAYRDPAADSLDLTRRLVARLRPNGSSDTSLSERYETMLRLLESDPELAAAFRTHIIHFTASRRMVTFFTDSGILPGTGFFLGMVAHSRQSTAPGSPRRAAPERLPARHL